MFNYYFLLLILIFIYNNVILLNEESLILFCSLGFIWLLIENLSSLTKFEFNQKKESFKKILGYPLRELIKSLKIILYQNNKFLVVFNNVTKLKKYCFNFVTFIINWSNNFTIKHIQFKHIKRLQFISNIEEQTEKLLVILFVLKLRKIIQLNNFYVIKLNHSSFSCIYKINIREIINYISNK